jgi:surface polysaccharide O-acyltransferase-like enzyme
MLYTQTFPPESFNWYFGLVFRQFIDFAIPMFLALAGYFSSYSRGSSVSNYWHRRTIRILPPYLFWTAIFILLQRPSTFLSPIAIAVDVLIGRGIGIGYFVIVLLQFIVITPLIANIRKSWQHIALMTLMTIVSLVLTYVTRIQYADSIFARFPFHSLPFFMWYPFYHLGVYMAQKKSDDDFILSKHTPIIFAMFLLFIGASIVEGVLFAYQGFWSFGISRSKATNFLASIALFLFAVGLHRKDHQVKDSFLSWIGIYTYPIYLMHKLFVPFSTSILKHFNFIYNMQPVFILLNVFIVTAACSIVILIVKIITPAWFQRKCIGI